MLDTTMASLERAAPAGATLVIRADVPKDWLEAAHARLLRHSTPRIVSVILFESKATNGTLACDGDSRRSAEYHNERNAALLLEAVHTEWDAADLAVIWRIDTELVSPIESPALPVGRVLVPFLQNGGLLNDRYLVGRVATIKTLIDARVALLDAECTYGEEALVRLLQQLNLSVSFTRTRIVRRRSDQWIPDIDRAASLGTIRPRGWMQAMNKLSPALRCNEQAALCTLWPLRVAMQSFETRVFGVHGVPHGCPYYRAWESHCAWSNTSLVPPKPLPDPSDAPRGRLLVLGDSIDGQLFAATACHLWEHRENGARLDMHFEAEWENGVVALRKRCGPKTKRCHYTRATLRVSGKDARRVPFTSMHLCQGDRAECLTTLGTKQETDVVVTGADALHGVAHGTRGAFDRYGVPNATVVAEAALRDARSALALVHSTRLIWREATAQHFEDLGGHWVHGFMMRSNVEKLHARCVNLPLVELRAHAHWNPAVAPLMATHGVRVLHTWEKSARAWYTHVDHGDCTHFCQPSHLLEGWVVALLRQLHLIM